VIDLPDSPERFWKYRPWNEHTRQMIVGGHAYFSTPKELNDPFEFYYQEKFPQSEPEMDRFVRELCASKFPLDTLPQRAERFHTLMAEVRYFVENS
jgi:hypothetical protein